MTNKKAFSVGKFAEGFFVPISNHAIQSFTYTYLQTAMI